MQPPRGGSRALRPLQRGEAPGRCGERGVQAGAQESARRWRTGRAWALKEMALRLWGYPSMGWAREAWLAWAALASRSKLERMVRAARMVRKHLPGDPQRGGAEGDQRGDGVDERRHPADQGDGVRLPQPRALRQRHPLPSRGAGPLPEARLNPHEFLKRAYTMHRCP